METDEGTPRWRTLALAITVTVVPVAIFLLVTTLQAMPIPSGCQFPFIECNHTKMPLRPVSDHLVNALALLSCLFTISRMPLLVAEVRRCCLS